jgi:hypothetical protein
MPSVSVIILTVERIEDRPHKSPTDGTSVLGTHPRSSPAAQAVRLTGKGQRRLNVTRPLRAQAQDRVLRELGPSAWADAQRRLARVLHVAVVKRRQYQRPKA